MFSGYFCWTGLLEEKLSFELFEKQDDKDAFLEKIRSVSRNLSEFPLEELQEIQTDNDAQIFGLQQRSMGELLRPKGESRCMNYSEFLEKWSDPTFRRMFEPLTSFIDGIDRSRQRPWRRLELTLKSLGELDNECKKLLGLGSTKSSPR